MIHNIVKDNNGNEHQAVESKGNDCIQCSLKAKNCESIFNPDNLRSSCLPKFRPDKTDVIYKRRIKITDITKAKVAV